MSKKEIHNNIILSQYEDHLVYSRNLSRPVAKHLVRTYGTASTRVIQLGLENSEEKKVSNEVLHKEFPFLKTEVLYASKYEMAEKPHDIIFRRVPIAFLS